MLPELAVAPRILGSPAAALTTILPELDSFLKSRGVSAASILPSLKPKLLSTDASVGDGTYNTQVIHALVLYVGSFVVTQLVRDAALSACGMHVLDVILCARAVVCAAG